MNPLHRCRVIGSPWAGVYAVETESGRHYGRHWHSDYVLGVLDAGAQRSASGRGIVEAQPGDLLCANPGEVHDGRPQGGPVRRWRSLYFARDAFADVAGGREVAVTRPVISDPQLRAALLRLLQRLTQRRHGEGTLACDEALVETLAQLVTRHAAVPPPREAQACVAAVRDFLADDLLATPSLSQLAAVAGLSRFQVLRRFQRAYGLPPHAWLQQQRAERARSLIRRGATLAQAAAASGFADQSHMTRVFVRHFGFTPGAWRLQ
ncbi:helix-turn-helix domain-containing protein [Ramlibacter albus]|uniref:AraC family transcriptional regulator n=1 Tax=Ramlibacter albus TaxID=2079448 RepID=A0A923MDS9_9BURK|nr:AraC family transcriptional regulator [Ramlibacter albus]MBC5768513.1 AraC family transcriptional regulator [Ramlibacter albus]